MSVFKIEKTKDYTIMSNYHLRDRNLSFKAKGLLSFMLSLPEDWDYSISGLVSVSKENIKAIRSTLKELEDNHYLIRERINLPNGKFDYDYSIYEIPYDQNGYAVNGNTLKDTQINTNIINTNKQIDKDDKTKSSFFIPEEHNILTLELVYRGFLDENDTQIFFYDKLFEDLLEEGNSYKDLSQIIHYIIPRVVNRKFKDEDGNDINNKFGYFKNALISNINKLNYNYEDLWGDDEYNWLTDELER